MTDRTPLERDFFRFVCQTSAEPLGITVDRAAGISVWDASGREYLDLLAGMGVANVGHSNPEVLAAIAEQAACYLHTLVYGEAIEGPQVRLAAEIARLAPGDLEVTFFANSGTEAIEGALKLARKYTGRRRWVAFRGGYHGDTLGALSLCDNPRYRQPFEPLLADVLHLPFDDEESLDQIDESVAAVVVEPIQGEGGVRVPHASFLPALRARCDAVGALLVCDEVMTGLGRTGKWFACQHWGVSPDVLVLAKALGGGMPLGAFVSRREVMATLSGDPPLSHVTTFGGHPLSCAAGLAALRYTERENLCRRAADLGEVWRQRLAEIGGELVREARGLGLLLGIEFHDAERCRAVCRAAFERGLILNWTLHRDTVVRLAPPLVMTDAESERALGAIAEAFADAGRN
jgi:acetylornithine/N-succinyldiaminopimelate aminotransferase